MNTRDPQALIEKLKTMAPERVAEVEDFVDFLRARDDERGLVRAATLTAAAYKDLDRGVIGDG